MILAFGDDHWRAPCFKRRQDVIEDEIVSRRVLSEACIKFLDGRLFIGTAPREPELRAPENDLVIEGPSGGLLMAFIDNDMPVIGDQIGDDARSYQALHEGHIDFPGRLLLSAMDNTERVRRNIQE